MGLQVKNPDALKWKCGRCDTWNSMENGTCKTCGSMAHQFASAYRVENTLTVEEQNYYKATAPHILIELRNIRKAIGALVEVLKEGRA